MHAAFPTPIASHHTSRTWPDGRPPSDVVQGHEVEIRVIQQPSRLRLRRGRRRRGRPGNDARLGPPGRLSPRGTGRWSPLAFEPIDERTDRDLIARLEANFLDNPPINANPVPTPEIPQDDPIVGDRQAAMATGDLRILDPGIAVDVPADEDDGPLKRDEGGRPWDHGDELE